MPVYNEMIFELVGTRPGGDARAPTWEMDVAADNGTRHGISVPYDEYIAIATGEKGIRIVVDDYRAGANLTVRKPGGLSSLLSTGYDANLLPRPSRVIAIGRLWNTPAVQAATRA
jgi:hypothetical protein